MAEIIDFAQARERLRAHALEQPPPRTEPEPEPPPLTFTGEAAGAMRAWLLVHGLLYPDNPTRTVCAVLDRFPMDPARIEAFQAYITDNATRPDWLPDLEPVT